jgi:hypothetical protein
MGDLRGLTTADERRCPWNVSRRADEWGWRESDLMYIALKCIVLEVIYVAGGRYRKRDSESNEILVVGGLDASPFRRVARLQ